MQSTPEGPTSTPKKKKSFVIWSALTTVIILLTIVAVTIGISMRTTHHATSETNHFVSVIIANGSWSSSNSQHFVPATITVMIGVNNTVVWTNDDSVFHTVTSYTGVFNSGLLNISNSWNFTFTTPGTYNYHCTLHSFMTGSVIVLS